MYLISWQVSWHRTREIKRNKMAEKIIQTAGREQLGEFAPMFAHLNDDVLFGEVWNEASEAVTEKDKY